MRQLPQQMIPSVQLRMRSRESILASEMACGYAPILARLEFAAHAQRIPDDTLAPSRRGARDDKPARPTFSLHPPTQREGNSDQNLVEP